jgi:hypothetical protein
MKKVLFALLVSLSLASACAQEAEPFGAPEEVGVEAEAISGQTCRDAYEECLADSNPTGEQQCACDNAYRHCMHRPEVPCLPE